MTEKVPIRLEEVPARITIQVREGVHNTLHEFDLVTNAADLQTPDRNADPAAKHVHAADVTSIISGLTGALISEARKYVNGVPVEQKGKVEEWLRKMMDWALNEIIDEEEEK